MGHSSLFEVTSQKSLLTPEAPLQKKSQNLEALLVQVSLEENRSLEKKWMSKVTQVCSGRTRATSTDGLRGTEGLQMGTVRGKPEQQGLGLDPRRPSFSRPLDLADG